MTLDKKNQRKIKLFVSHPPQKHFLLLECGVFLTALVFLLAATISTIASVFESAYGVKNLGDKLNPIFDQLTHFLFLKTSAIFAVAFLFNVLLGLLFLERLTGPLQRIQKALEEIGGGRVPESDVYLRKGDYPTDLADALSSAIAYLRRQKAGI